MKGHHELYFLVSDLLCGSLTISATSNSSGVGKNGKYRVVLLLLDEDD